MNDDVKSLLKQGIEAARAGDKKKARELFDRVLEIDEDNERAWLWMVSVADTEEEKKIYLGNVLYINPNNERAQAMLSKLEQGGGSASSEGGGSRGGGISRNTLLIGGGVLGALLIIVVLLAVVISVNNRREEQERILASQLTAQVQSTFDAANRATDVAAAATGTEAAIVDATATARGGTPASPTPPPSPTAISELPPTWTPVATVESGLGAALGTPLPAPQGLGGVLYGWGGLDRSGDGFVALLSFDLGAGGTRTEIPGFEGRDITVEPITGDRIMFTRPFSATRDFGIQLANRNGTQPEQLADRWRGQQLILGPQYARFSPDGSRVVFTGRAGDTNSEEVWLLNLQVPEGVPALTRLTDDTANYSYPDISPDNSRVVAVRVDTDSLSPAEDLVLIDTVARTQGQLTNDQAAFIESHPRFSPNGALIAYSASQGSADAPADIIIINVNGGGTPVLPVRSNGDDIQPIFSPDGNAFAFSSDRNGEYNIYLFNLQTNELFQLTNEIDPHFVGGWFQAGAAPQAAPPPEAPPAEAPEGEAPAN